MRIRKGKNQMKFSFYYYLNNCTQQGIYTVFYCSIFIGTYQ